MKEKSKLVNLNKNVNLSGIMNCDLHPFKTFLGPNLTWNANEAINYFPFFFNFSNKIGNSIGILVKVVANRFKQRQ